MIRNIACAALVAVGLGTSNAASAESVLRIAMTASDIPDYVGLPDQGMEGYRFVGFQLYEGLIGWDLSRSDIEPSLKPALATQWLVDPVDRNKWVFQLREGVTFHDGCAWNADSAVWNFERLTKPGVPQFNTMNYARGRSKTTNIDHVEKLGPYSIAIYTKTPESLFLYNIPPLLMISNCAYNKAGNDYNVYAKTPSGTGPYRFAAVTPHERLELARNAFYWDKSRVPHQDKLILLPMPEPTTRAAALLTGQVDFIEAPAPDTIPRLKAAGMNVLTGPYPHTWDYILNFYRGPFTDLRVRQAANYAVNREDVVEMLDGVALPGYGIFVPGSKFAGDFFRYKTSTEKAKALLKDAGCYPCNITVGISTSGSGQMQPQPMNEVVKAQLEAAGFRVTFDVMDWSAMVEVFNKGAQAFPKYDAINYSLSVIDPLSGFIKHLTTAYRTPVGLNWGGYYNPEIDRLADQVLATFDIEEQTKLIQQMHQVAVKDAARVFIVHDLNPRALSSKLHGFVQAQSYYVDLTPVTMSP